jgi:F420-non-reducing hydrogenase small subunit
MYWTASCGGCEMSLLSLNEKFLELNDHFEIIFCPCLIDTKRADIEAMHDKELDITLINGAIRMSENEEMAMLLRRKSKILVAFGSCACEGCVPGLANLWTSSSHIRTNFTNNITTVNPRGISPLIENERAEGTLRLPFLLERVKTLDQTVEVDYYLPGCPPEEHSVAELFTIFSGRAPLPPKGSVIGAGRTAVCNECPRTKGEKRLVTLSRTFEKAPDDATCLIDQGIICMGIATREGCGCLCPKAAMPCTGCYGPPEGVRDVGARMVSALASVIDIGSLDGLSAVEIARRIDTVLDTLPDYVGTFYKYSLAASLLSGAMRDRI